MPRAKVPDAVVQARWQATQSVTGLLSRDVVRLFEDFATFSTLEARAAFADKWIALVAAQLEETWPVWYELLHIVESEGLFAKPEALEGQRTFESFHQYFEAKTGKPFTKWQEVEEAYHFVQRYRPDLFKATLSKATEARAQHYQQLDAENEKVRPKGRPGDQEPSIDDPTENHYLDNDLCREKASQGTSSAYTMRRLKNDRPDLYKRCLSGEITAYSASREAGYRKDKTPLQHVQTAWKHATLDDKRLIVGWIHDQLQQDDDLRPMLKD